MRTDTPTPLSRRLTPLRLLVALGLCAATAACGDESAGPGPAHPPDRTGERARQVSAAWKGSEATRAWRAGYFPLGAAVLPSDGGFRDGADRRAYATRNFELGTPLPADPPEQGEIHRPDGGCLAVPVSSARAAYEALDRDAGPGPSLVVTGARLGTMPLFTSRGPATVPAWHFTVAGYGTALRHAAAVPSRLPPPPIGPVARTSHALYPLSGLVSVARDGRAVVLRAHHGSCDEGPAVDVLETGDNVVFSGWIRGHSDGPCTAELRTGKVTAKLDRPTGDRVLLDAFTGRPVPYAGAAGPPAPSWG